MKRQSDRSRFARQLVFQSVSICIFILIVVIFGYASYEDRQNAWRLGEQSVRNVARLAEQAIGREFELYDLSLQEVLDGLQDSQVMSLDPTMKAKILFDRSASADGLGYIIVTDRAGNIVIDSKSTDPRTGNLADREYFKYHLTHDDPQPYVSNPFLARYSGNVPTIALSRRISAPDGSFLGIVSGNMRIAHLESILQKVSLGTAGGLALRREDGTLIARSFPLPKMSVLHWEGSDPAQNAEASEGTFSRRTDDGLERLYAFRRIAGTSLILIAGVPVRDILGSWVLRTIILGCMIFATAASIVFLVVSLVREVARRASAERMAHLLAHTDGLTGVANRRAFDEALPRDMQNAARAGTHLSLLMLDVDWFKNYNDIYGHLSGDLALKQIAATLQGAIRIESDLLARFGGEEFAIVIAHDDPHGAAIVARRVLDAVGDLVIVHPASRFGHMTVSCGVATCASGGMSFQPETLIAAADAALYRAKSGGRNCVVDHAEWRAARAA